MKREATATLQGSGSTSKPRSGNKLLVIGASHTMGSFGKKLERLWRDEYGGTHRCAVSGSRTVHWISGSDHDSFKSGGGKGICVNERREEKVLDHVPAFSQVLDSADPDVVVIALGTNMVKFASTEDGARKIRKRVGDLTALVPDGVHCVWVGPPMSTHKKLWEHVPKTASEIKSGLAGKCSFVDSVPLTSPAMLYKDKIHLTSAGGKRWAERVFERVQNVL